MNDSGPNRLRGIPGITLMEGPRDDGREYDFQTHEELLARIKEQLERQGYDTAQISSFIVYASTGKLSPEGVPLDISSESEDEGDDDGGFWPSIPSWNAWSVDDIERYLQYPDDDQTPLHDVRYQDGPGLLVIAQPEHFVEVPGAACSPSPDYTVSDIVLLVDLPNPLG